MMHINEAGLDLLMRFEGCRLKAYRDAGGIWTIGYGHTGKDVHPGMTLDHPAAIELLADDVRRFERAVERAVHDVPTTGNQFSAMVCLAYNIGEGGFARSTVLRQHRKGSTRLAGAAFMLWVKVGKRVLKGLVRRRNAERRLYAS